MIEAILWDNDGVLVDTEPLYLRATREVLGAVGIEFDDDQYREISLKQGASLFGLAAERGHSAQDIAALRARRDERYAKLLDAGVDVLPGVPECLAALRGRLRMAVVTSSRRDHFDCIRSSLEFLKARL